jgi:hypothetical protein
MTLEGLGEVFKGDSADMCARKFPLESMYFYEESVFKLTCCFLLLIAQFTLSSVCSGSGNLFKCFAPTYILPSPGLQSLGPGARYSSSSQTLAYCHIAQVTI